MVILENIDIDIDIDKAILQNIDIDKISNRFKFGISNRAIWTGRVTIGCPDRRHCNASVYYTLKQKPNLIRRFSCVLCLVLNSAVLLKGIRREFAGEGEVRFNLDRSASSSSCPPLCVLSSSRRCSSRCSRSRRSTSTTSTPPPTLHIEEKQRRGSHSAGQGRGGVSVWGEIETAKSSNTDSP